MLYKKYKESNGGEMRQVNNDDDNTRETMNLKKILLGLLPFWTPLIPPMGIATLKSYLHRYGYQVKIVDATIHPQFKEIYDRYFNQLKEYVPENKRANFYNVGHDVLQNHMMAQIHYKDEHEYIELVKTLIYKTFFTTTDDRQVDRLNSILSEFYTRLEKYILNLVEAEKPEVFGLTAYCHTLPASLFAFKLVKEKYPHIKTVMGGGIFVEQLSIGSENLDFFVTKTPYIDKMLVGEGEKLLLKFLRDELDKSKKVYTLMDIGEEKLDFSDMTCPDFSDLDYQVYPYIGAFGSQGCPFQCSFCSQAVFYGKYRKKPPEQIVQEMTQLNKTFNCQLFNMTDALLNPIITDLAKEIIKNNVSIYWEGYLRVAKPVLDIENTILWRHGGFYRALMGIESGSQRVLDLMNKKITPEQSKDALSSLAYSGIKTTTYWVIGHPGETEADFQKTLDFLEEARDDIYEAEAHPFQFVTLNGQVNSKEWAKQSSPLYPINTRDMIIIQTPMLNCDPSREEVYSRLNRFARHIEKLGIPNPYSIKDIYQADQRWKELHKNTVPSLMEFKNETVYIGESRRVKKIYSSQKKVMDEGDFSF